MSAGLLGKLPVEIRGEVVKDLPLDARLQLSSTHSHWRTYFAPSLFRTIKFTNLKRDEESIAAVFSGKCAQYASRLVFECHLKREPSDDSSPEPEAPDSQDQSRKLESDGNKLTDIAAKILRGEVCPGATSIEISFLPENDFIGMGLDRYAGETGMWTKLHDDEDSVDEDEMKDIEAEWPWLAVMAQAWACLAVNPAVKCLDIFSLPPTWTSTWCTTEWRAFLGRLEGLSIDIWGVEAEPRWLARNHESYWYFLRSLDEAILIPARNLRRLSIIAEASNPYGGDSYTGPCRPMSLRSLDMPKLETVRLENCVIDRAVVGFIQSHSKCLRRIHLVNCWSIQDDSYDPNITWADLFNGIAQHPLVLSEFVVTNEEDLLDNAYELGLGDEAELVRNELALDNKRRLFAFGNEAWEGKVWLDVERVTERFMRGEDQAAYDRLMEIVERNRRQKAQLESGVAEQEMPVERSRNVRKYLEERDQ